MIACLDFETYSEAGYRFDGEKWRVIQKAAKSGLAAVGASAYSEHPSTEVLCAAYDLHDGYGPDLWLPCLPPPKRLFDYVGNIESWNSSFEWFIWNNVCVPKYGWPPLSYQRQRDAMARARAFSLPGSLDVVAKFLGVTNKIADGKRLLDKFSKPRNPTKTDPRMRIRPEDDPIDAAKLYEYCLGDIKTEAEISALLPELSQSEQDLWLLDQYINLRGVAVDTPTLDGCIAIVNQAFEKYNAEIVGLTGGVKASQIRELGFWLLAQGVPVDTLTEENVTSILERELPPICRRVLEIRQLIGSASIKKLFSLKNRLSRDGRIRGLFSFCGADRTGRWSGLGPQPQNLPKSGPDVSYCKCKNYFGTQLTNCPFCGLPFMERKSWSGKVAEYCMPIIRRGDLAILEGLFDDPVGVVSGCLRGLYISEPGSDLVCSDYSAIEAVALAELAGEKWRQDVFRTHGKIYEMSASKITGTPFEEFARYKAEHKDHHPHRKLGKVAELASGYQGHLGAWKKFKADKFLTDQEIKDAVYAWRKESPMIVKFWYAMEECAISAIQCPGKVFGYRGIHFKVEGDYLRCRLLSGRCLTYHKPRLYPETRYGRDMLKIAYDEWDSQSRTWVTAYTYGGKLTENIDQAICRDLLAYSLKGLAAAGYAPVLHVHDEPVGEIAEGCGSIEEFERIMMQLPDWAVGWPVRAAGGWRGKRYRKD
jgi:DNA polymerase